MNTVGCLLKNSETCGSSIYPAYTQGTEFRS
uniref:Uncharacterized protein n=1 Tax=Arundo donax TaxID=35708 RepID=A0A0A9H2R9_ARUDO